MSNEFSTVDCCEEYGTASEQWSEDAITASVVLRCDWDNAQALVADILGNRRVWPYLIAVDGPRAINAVIVGSGPYVGVGQAMAYIDALVTVQYSTNAEEDLVSESLEPTTEFLTLDYRRFRWGDEDGDPLLEAESPGLLKRGLVLSRTLYRVEPPLPAVLLTGVGGVNHATYASSLLGLSFPAETLLYIPGALSRSITTSGAKAFTVPMKFQYKPDGWNTFYRAATNTYEKIWSIDSGAEHNSYPLVDYSSILA